MVGPQFFSGPPLCIRKKKCGPPHCLLEKFWSPFGLVKKFWSPPPRWKSIPFTQTMEEDMIRLKIEFPWGWEKIRSYMNMLCGMKYDKEKGCGEGVKNLWVMYLGRNCAEGAKKWRKNFGPPSLHNKLLFTYLMGYEGLPYNEHQEWMVIHSWHW